MATFIIVPTIYHIFPLYMFRCNSYQDTYKGWFGPWGIFGTIDNHIKKNKRIENEFCYKIVTTFSYKHNIKKGLHKIQEDHGILSKFWETQMW